MLLAPLCALSGLCGLAYEVLWARMLSLQFGVSTLAAVVTVSAFMLGLAGGSAAMAAHAARAARPLQRLALLESAVAVFALLLPWGVRFATPLIDGAAGSFSAPQWHALLMLAGLLLLTLPAAAMGAGFPLMVEAWIRSGRTLGGAYGSNTAGAALGALAPLLLLPTVGWMDAVRWVAAINLGVAAGFLALARQGTGSAPTAAPAAGRPPRLLLLNYAVIGAASLLLEMAWLRLFSLVMLRTEYVLALILAVMLLGMGLGSLMASRRPGSRMMAALPWCASVYAIAGLWLLPRASAWLEGANFRSLTTALLAQGLMLAALTLPVTLSLGAWLPALAARFRSNGTWLYASNALGGSVRGAALCPSGSRHRQRRRARIGRHAPAGRRDRSLGSPAGRGSACRWSPPPLGPWPSCRRSRISCREPWPAAATCIATKMRLRPPTSSNSRTDSAFCSLICAVRMPRPIRRPCSCRPTNPGFRCSCIRIRIGCCSSAWARVFRWPVRCRSPASTEARWSCPRGASRPRGGGSSRAIEGSCRTPRFITTMRATFWPQRAGTYDVVIGDVFHPDLAGVGSLLAVEQFERVRARLAAGGLYVQWLALNQFDPDTLCVVLRSFRAVFPKGQLFLDGMHLAMVGPRDGGSGAPSLSAHLSSLTPDERAEAASEGESEWLGRYWGPIEPRQRLGAA